MNQAALAKEMRELWKRVRLSSIRSTVDVVIAQLEAGEVEGARTQQPVGEADEELGPVRAALLACCDELRAGCGMALLHESSDPLQVGHVSDQEWDRRRTEALESYRAQAHRALCDALGRTV